MPWQSLPYHILTSIFAHASSPLIDYSQRCSTKNNVKLLLDISTLCKTFTEPALSVLYFSPPIVFAHQVDRLVELLTEGSRHPSSINYRSKIKYIELKDPYISNKRNHNLPSLNYLISLIPQLRGIRLGLSDNNASGYRYNNHKRCHTGTPSIIASLDTAHVALEAWAWSYEVDELSVTMPVMKQLHTLDVFSRLKSLTVNEVSPDMFEKQSDGKNDDLEQALADAINAIHTLKELRLSRIYLDGEVLLPLLPGRLEELALVNCPNFRSQGLHAFLVLKGQDLLALTLDHNKALNLSFLKDLIRTCPKLQSLRMDLVYYNSHLLYHDADPVYEAVLLEGEEPSWPTSLRSLELLQIRKWSTGAAGTFFSSLVQSAESLPDLRYLKIKASLNESGWRDRIAFRDSWSSQLRDVFAIQRESHTDLPIPIVPSRAQPRKNSTSEGEASGWELIGSQVGSGETDDRRPVKNRRSARIHRSARDTNHITREIGPVLSTSTADRGKILDNVFVQGKCEIVDVVIDNLRPTEEQLHESDFLDEEQSGDEDWNARDDNITFGHSSYAW